MTTQTHTVPSMPAGSPAPSPQQGSIAQQSWAWLIPYVVIIFVLILIGSLLGDLGLFKRANLGTQKLNASQLVKFLSYSGALLMVWLIAQRSALQTREQAGKTEFLGSIVLPVAVLIMVSSGYNVLLIVLKSLMDPGMRNLYNWLFVFGITASALWLVLMLFRNSEPMIELFRDSSETSPKAVCPKCNQANASTAQFCSACGTALR